MLVTPGLERCIQVQVLHLFGNIHLGCSSGEGYQETGRAQKDVVRETSKAELMNTKKMSLGTC